MKNITSLTPASKRALPYFAKELINHPNLDPACYWLVSVLMADFDHAPRIPDLVEYVNRDRFGRNRITKEKIKKMIKQLEATGHLEIRRVMIRPQCPAMEWTLRFQNQPPTILQASEAIHVMV